MKNISMKSTQLIEDSYTNYHHSVYLYIYYRIAHKEEAEDLAQDVYVRADGLRSDALCRDY